MRSKRFFLLLVSVFIVSACSSKIPQAIKQDLDNAPSLQQARNFPQDYVASNVRWGGIIVDTQNRDQSTWLTIVAFPLDSDGYPSTAQQSSGRFIAVVNEFLEPLVYKKDRRITLTGEYVRTQTFNVGEYPYLYPVVEVDVYHLWPQKLPSADHAYPPYWRYDPWYDPWYYRDYPYWHYHPKHLIPKHE